MSTQPYDPYSATPPYTPAPQPPKKKSGVALVVGGVVAGVLVLCGIGTALVLAGGDEPDATYQPPVAQATQPAAPPTSAPATSAPAPPPPPVKPPPPPAPVVPTIDEGIWTVGEDIPAGTYKVIERAGGECYWSRSKPDGDIIANHFGPGLPKVTVKRGEVFETSGCPVWRKVG